MGRDHHIVLLEPSEQQAAPGLLGDRNGAAHAVLDDDVVQLAPMRVGVALDLAVSLFTGWRSRRARPSLSPRTPNRSAARLLVTVPA